MKNNISSIHLIALFIFTLMSIRFSNSFKSVLFPRSIMQSVIKSSINNEDSVRSYSNRNNDENRPNRSNDPRRQKFGERDPTKRVNFGRSSFQKESSGSYIDISPSPSQDTRPRYDRSDENIYNRGSVDRRGPPTERKLFVNPRNGYQYSKEEKKEPAYGQYDGDHLYGVSPVYTAIKAGRRKIAELLLQDGMEISNKKDEKCASDILKLCKDLNIPTREFSKHDLNMLTDNRPHQGFVLRASPLQFEGVDYLQPSSEFK